MNREIWYYRPSAFFLHPLSLIGKIRKRGLRASLRAARSRFYAWGEMGLSLLALPYKLARFHSADHEAILDFGFSNKAIEPLQVRSELRRFVEMVAERKPQTIMEIGTCYGGTLFPIARVSASDATIISLDFPSGDSGGDYSRLHRRILRRLPLSSQRLHIVWADSHSQKTGEQIRQLVDRPLDLLFIDGDHSYEGVRQDFEMYAPLVRPGGLIAFHDIAESNNSYDQVQRFWNEIKGNYQHQEIIENPKQGWAGIGVLYQPLNRG